MGVSAHTHTHTHTVAEPWQLPKSDQTYKNSSLDRPGALFWLWKNHGRAILAAEKPCAYAHSGILTYRLGIFDA